MCGDSSDFLMKRGGASENSIATAHHDVMRLEPEFISRLKSCASESSQRLRASFRTINKLERKSAKKNKIFSKTKKRNMINNEICCKEFVCSGDLTVIYTYSLKPVIRLFKFVHYVPIYILCDDKIIKS